MRRLTFIAMALTAAGAGSAQDLPKPPPQFTLSQFVFYSDGRPVQKATVIVTAVTPNPTGRARVATTDSTGLFRIDSLPGGDYTVEVLIPRASRQAPPRRVTVNGSSAGDFIVQSAPQPSSWWTWLVLGLFLFTIMVARWHNIARSLEAILRGQLRALRTRLVTEVDPGKSGQKEQLEETIRQIEAEYVPRPPWWGRIRLAEFLFWSRGRENAAYIALHEVERQLAAVLAPPERVVSYLHVAHAQLRVINSPTAIAVADAIRESLPAKCDEPTTTTVDEKRKALLGRAITIAYEERDKQFSILMEWHNKASWLILGAILIIGFLSVAAGNGVLFLAGAAGGFSSRVMRALRREDLPLDYGASWTTLFLSPLFGALAAWFGIAIIRVATQPDINLLGKAFEAVDWTNPTGPITLAAAFLLGFSERFFDAVVGAVERHAAVSKAAEAAGREKVEDQPLTGRKAGEGTAESPFPGSAGGVTLELPDEPLPVQTVQGTVTLDNPATTDTGVIVTTDNPAFVAPAALTIAANATEVTFDVVPQGAAAPAPVRVTARVGSVQVSRLIEFE